MSAGPESPAVAICPSCKGMVVKRSRRRRGDQTPYFYRHKRGVRYRLS